MADFHKPHAFTLKPTGGFTDIVGDSVDQILAGAPLSTAHNSLPNDLGIVSDVLMGHVKGSPCDTGIAGILFLVSLFQDEGFQSFVRQAQGRHQSSNAGSYYDYICFEFSHG
ncbi:hypothetical protein GCM10027288_00350 [Bordetella tumbae]